MFSPNTISPLSDSRQTRTHAFGMGLILASTLFFSGMSLLTRVGSEWFRADSFVFLRCLIQALCLLPLGRELWPGPERRRPFLKAQFSRGAVGIVSMWLLYYALARLPLGMVSMLTLSSALWASLAARIFLGERQGWVRVGMAGWVCLGLLLVLWPEKGSAAWTYSTDGILAACASGVSMGIAQTLLRQLSKQFRTRETVFWMGVFGALLSAPVFFQAPQWPADWTQASVILGVGVLALLGQLFLTRGFRYTPTLQGSLCVLFGNVWNILFGVVFLSELPPPAFWLGAVIAVSAVVGLMLAPRGPSPQEA
ncbi:DMT family transporter [bacterium]|nr:DMT family transporter [bacterium]